MWRFSKSDYIAHRCLGVFKPKSNDGNANSWEQLDISEVNTHGCTSFAPNVFKKMHRQGLCSWMGTRMVHMDFGVCYNELADTFVLVASPSKVLQVGC